MLVYTINTRSQNCGVVIVGVVVVCRMYSTSIYYHICRIISNSSLLVVIVVGRLASVLWFDSLGVE